MAYLQLFALSFALFSWELAQCKDPSSDNNRSPMASAVIRSSTTAVSKRPEDNNQSPVPPASRRPEDERRSPMSPASRRPEDERRSPMSPASRRPEDERRSPMSPASRRPDDHQSPRSADRSHSPVPIPSRMPSAMPRASPHENGKASVMAQTSSTLLANRRVDLTTQHSQSITWVWALAGVLSPTLIAVAAGLWRHRQHQTAIPQGPAPMDQSTMC